MRYTIWILLGILILLRLSIKPIVRLILKCPVLLKRHPRLSLWLRRRCFSRLIMAELPLTRCPEFCYGYSFRDGHTFLVFPNGRIFVSNHGTWYFMDNPSRTACLGIHVWVHNQHVYMLRYDLTFRAYVYQVVMFQARVFERSFDTDIARGYLGTVIASAHSNYPIRWSCVHSDRLWILDEIRLRSISLDPGATLGDHIVVVERSYHSHVLPLQIYPGRDPMTLLVLYQNECRFSQLFLMEVSLKEACLLKILLDTNTMPAIHLGPVQGFSYVLALPDRTILLLAEKDSSEGMLIHIDQINERTSRRHKYPEMAFRQATTLALDTTAANTKQTINHLRSLLLFLPLVILEHILLPYVASDSVYVRENGRLSLIKLLH